jgi:hypothetical protein
MADITPVGPRDPSAENSPIAAPAADDSTVVLDTAARVCVWNGAEFGDGSRVCSEGTVYECSYGKWMKTSEAC